MKKFTYKTLLKYTFCAISFFIMNNLSKGVPLSISLIPAFMSVGFLPIGVCITFLLTTLISFSAVESLCLTVSAIFFTLIFSFYKIKRIKVKGELFIYVALSLIPYYSNFFTGSIYTKLVYSAIIYTFSLIFTLSFKRIFINGFKRKNSLREQIAFYLSIIVISLGGIEILGLEIYQLIALTVMLFLCKFYKNTKAFIPAFILPVAISIYTHSLSPLAIFEIYCASIIAFISLSPLLSALSLIVAQFAVCFVSGNLFTFTVYDYIITFTPSLIYLFTPQKAIDKLKKYFLRFEEPEITREIINDERGLLCLKLNELSGLFYDMEQSLNSFDAFFLTNEKLCEKIIDETIVGVCTTCPFYTDCLRKKHPKRSDLEKLINIGISKEKVSLIDLSRDFSSYCFSVNNMIFEINRLISLYLEHTKTAEQTKRYKKVISAQAGAVGEVLKNLAFDFSSRVEFKSAKEKKIFNRLAEEGFVVNQIYLVGSEYHLLFDKEQKSFSKIAEILSLEEKKLICLKKKCEVGNGILTVFSFAPKMDASFGVAQLAKEGCAVSGDSHSLTKINDGKFIISLCDGMGSGGKAHKNSHVAISLFETLYKCGLSKESSLELANKMLCVCSEDSFSSLDCAIFDLYEGCCDVIKIGATHGFLLGENSIQIIENKSLPLGILEEICPDMATLSLSDGDMLVILSDGISDAFFSSTDTLDFLQAERSNNPQTLADRLLQYAIDHYEGKAKDDMTALVVKVYEKSL